jgi:hypothetical protein
MRVRGVLLAVAAMLSPRAGAATTWYVDDDNCPGPGSGTEADPFCSIQSAIMDAADGDEIIVAAGTYFETVNLVGKAVTLRSSAGPQDTVIDAQGNGTVVIGAGAAVLDGFTITGGWADNGGGMLNSSGSPTVVDCRFVNNSAVLGGALYGDAGTATLVDCCFITNVATSGGALRFDGGEVVIEGCTFIGNFADFNGGAILGLHAAVALTDCILSGNEADVGGAIDAIAGTLRLVGCRLVGNQATAGGGAIFDGENLEFEIVDCDVSDNSAVEGGGIYVSTFGSEIVNCTVASNQGYGVRANVGASGLTAANCVLWDNLPGAIDGAVPSSTVTYSDVEGGWTGPGSNNIDADPQFAVDVTGTWTSDPVYDPATDRTVLIDASANFAPDGLVGRSIVPNSGLPSIRTVVLANTANTITLIGELWSVIVNPGDTYQVRDNQLSADSPCIDAADNTAVPPDVTTDLNGNPRFLEIPEVPDTGNGDPPIVDMGAYESLGGGCLAITNLQTVCYGDGSTFTVNVEGLNACTGGTMTATFTGSGGAVGEDFCATLIVNTEQGGYCCSTQVCVPVPDCAVPALPGDLNGDGWIGVPDVLLLLDEWGSCPECGTCAADVDGDCEVGVGDFLLLLAGWT